MYKLTIPCVFAMGLLVFATPVIAGKTCKDGVSPKSSGCPLEFSEQLLAYDNFDDGLDGWSKWASSDPICGGDPMLVLTPNAGTPASKVYDTLPDHNFVRVQATAYFIDDWQGETAALAIDGEYVWTEGHEQRGLIGSLDICGSSAFPESKLGVPIDITIPHSGLSLSVSALTTLPDGATAELALDDVRISVFTYAP